MKTRISIAAVMAFALAAFASPARAATEVVTAEAVIGGTPEVSFTLAVASAADPINDRTPIEISWDGINPGVTGWKIAEEVLVLNAVVTDANGRIQIYTDNKGAGANPEYTGPTTGVGSNPAGLVGVGAISNSRLPLAWSVKAATRTVESGANAGIGIGASDPETGPSDGIAYRYQWLWMKDKSTPNIVEEGTTAFVEGEEYVTVWKGSGIHVAGGNLQYEPHSGDAYIYLQANFGGALAQQTYRTNRLTVESITQ